MQTARPSTPQPAVHPLLQSRLGLLLLMLGVLFIQFLHNGYECFRSDHLTQIPLVYMQHDSTLFARDWFLQKYAHFDVRYFHLLLLNAFALPLGLPAGILALYGLLIMATLAAWCAIARKLYGSPLPGLVVGVMAVWMNGIEPGSNHLLENIMIPRTEAYPCAYWGLYLLLAGHPFVAGLLLALAGYFQAAVGVLFALPMLVWLLQRRRHTPARLRFKQAGYFAAGLGLASLVPIWFLRHGGVLEAGSISPTEYIHLAAYIRHPHHMLPHLWINMWIEFGALFLLFYALWRAFSHRNHAAWTLGKLAPVIMILLAVATIFIEWYPTKPIVLLQPYRMSVLLYFVFAMILAPHVLDLLGRPCLLARARGILLINALPLWQAYVPFALVELWLLTGERRGRPLDRRVAALLLLAVLALPLLLVAKPQEYRSDLKTLLFKTTLLVVLVTLFFKLRFPERPRLMKGLLAGGAAVGLLLISAFFWLPMEHWINDGPRSYRKKLGTICYKYQFDPIALKGLERIGLWAQKNTAKDALFLIPPERQPPGFHIWSKRSAFFSLKFFPYTPRGLKEWRERFLVVHGITDTRSTAGKMALNEALNDIGGGLLEKVYENLSVAQIMNIAQHYGVDYMITQSRYADPRLPLIYQDHDLTKSVENDQRRPFYLYKIQNHPALTASAGHQSKGSIGSIRR